MPLVLESHRDPVRPERPQILAQRVVKLALPLAGEKRPDRVTARDELVAVAPLRVDGVRIRDTIGIARVPRSLGGADFLASAVGVERGNGWARKGYAKLLLRIVVLTI